ncbi:MAG: 4-alpha-glucanotransferase [Clostridiales Family XIII bacterium]|jgi:4-alpha-glucanotransferase|nr:4-alpha-glucanotransferase [Clostridiales Family XIII bacterium]
MKLDTYFKPIAKQSAGLLLPLFSLPSPYGIGSMGRAAFGFVDFLADAGQRLWQILPMGPTDQAGSPYKGISAFAGNPLLIDLDLLAEDGLLTERELREHAEATAAAANPRIDYALQHERKTALLHMAAERLSPDPSYREFARANSWWLDGFASYAARVEGSRAAGAGISEERQRRIQYIFEAQWRRLKEYANGRGIGIVGDLPFYVGSESADFEAHPELFATDSNGRPSLIAGVPPDAFTEDGQIWNEPVYDWEEHRRTGYAWWLRRVSRAAELYDLCRVDHFRAFAQYFAIPAGRPAKEGRWMDGPGHDFIDAVRKAAPGFKIIAEDLGIITQDVHELREYSGYPGMRVLQFAFEPNGDSIYLPHNHIKNCVVYTGTHDNPTLCEWAAGASWPELDFALSYLGATRENIAQKILEAALGSVADTVIIPLQDYMGLGAEARINTPGTVSEKNWTWRLSQEALTEDLAETIRGLVKSRSSHTTWNAV